MGSETCEDFCLRAKRQGNRSCAEYPGLLFSIELRLNGAYSSVSLVEGNA